MDLRRQAVISIPVVGDMSISQYPEPISVYHYADPSASGAHFIEKYTKLLYNFQHQAHNNQLVHMDEKLYILIWNQVYFFKNNQIKLNKIICFQIPNFSNYFMNR